MSQFDNLYALQQEWWKESEGLKSRACAVAQAIERGEAWENAAEVNCVRNKPYVTRKAWRALSPTRKPFFSSPLVAKFNGSEWEGISGPFSGAEGGGFTLEVWV